MNNTTKDTCMTRVMMNAMIGWMIDCDMCHPINIVCDASMFDTGILNSLIDEHGHIMLNISGQATRDFRYNDRSFSFNGWKQGGPVPLDIPYEAVLGFMLQVDEDHASFFSLPNMERVAYAIKQGKIVAGHLKEVLDKQEGAKPLKSVPFAVFDPEQGEQDFDDNQSAPTTRELMNRKPLEERGHSSDPVARPLLDFGDVGGINLQSGRPRHVAKPKLTLIQGGKK